MRRSLLAAGMICVLALQNALETILMQHASRHAPRLVTPAEVVLWSEMLKLLMSAFLWRWSTASSPKPMHSLVNVARVENAVPAVLYAIQNQFKVASQKVLQPHLFAILSQSKIVFAALAAWTAFGIPSKWAKIRAVGELSFSTIIVVAARGHSHGGDASGADASGGGDLYGVIYLFVACAMSGVNGAVVQHLLKRPAEDIWFANMGLAFWGIVAAGTTVAISELGLTLPPLVFVLPVLVSSLGGLLVALVLRHADNVAKSFAMGMAVAITVCYDVLMTHQLPSVVMMAGTSLVALSSFNYFLA